MLIIIYCTNDFGFAHPSSFPYSLSHDGFSVCRVAVGSDAFCSGDVAAYTRKIAAGEASFERVTSASFVPFISAKPEAVASYLSTSFDYVLEAASHGPCALYRPCPHAVLRLPLMTHYPAYSTLLSLPTPFHHSRRSGNTCGASIKSSLPSLLSKVGSACERGCRC
jgi:hypothetical protein